MNIASCQNYMATPTRRQYWPISSELHFPQFVCFSKCDWLAT